MIQLVPSIEKYAGCGYCEYSVRDESQATRRMFQLRSTHLNRNFINTICEVCALSLQHQIQALNLGLGI